MSKPTEFVPIGIDLGSLHARVAIGNINHSTPVDGVTDIRVLPNVISNAQGSRYTLALVGLDIANAEENGKTEETRHIFGEAG